MTGASLGLDAAVSFRNERFGGRVMTKRILAMLLASLIIITSVPFTVSAAEAPYMVSLTADSQDKVLGIGDTATVKVMVAGRDDSVTGYNAYDLKITYDTQYLTFISAENADSGTEVTDTDGRIRVKGYGDEKSFSIAAVVLRFEVKAPGSANVHLTHAKIDISDHAGLQNAPEAALTERTVRITIDGFEVATEGEGIGVNANVASSSENYVFWLNDYKNYDYTVTVTIGGVDMTAKVIYDEDTGKYTIPKGIIDGRIVIRAERTPKIYTVTITGKDVTGEKTAEYNTDYCFKLNREDGYLYTVEITIGGKVYTGYSVKGDIYTIPGTDITGKIQIKVTKEEDNSNKVTVTFAGTGAKDGSGQKKTERGVEYPFKVKKKKGYTYTVTVYVDGKWVPYDYDYELDTYYILSENVTGNIVIVIGKTATVEVTEYITMDKESMYLIVYNGIVDEGQVPKYDGQSMYWSERYKAYAWLVVSSDTEKKVKKTAEEKIKLTEGTAAGTIDYSGNVNMTLRTDIADAKLVREMYEARHLWGFTEMRSLLNADVYSDKKLNVRDVQTIVNSIS